MEIFYYLKIFLILLPIVLLIDLLWIAIFAKKFYKKELGSLARRKGEALSPNWPASLLVYLLIVFGYMVFVLPKVQAAESVPLAILWGVLFGLVIGGVYNLTNFAILEKYSFKIVIVDMLWGLTIGGIIGFLLFNLDKLLQII